VDVNVEFDAAQRFFRVTPEDPLSFEQFVSTFDVIFTHPSFHPGANILWDFRRADVGRVDRESLQRIVVWAQNHADLRRGSRVAIVTARDADFGVARMFELTAGSRLAQDIRVFRDLAEAAAWMRREHD